jgi:single-stranded DNA-binding protein
LGEYAASKLKKGDHLYVEGTLVSSTYEKEVGKGKSKVKIPITTWQIKSQSIRKLNHLKRAQPAMAPPVEVRPDDIPF